MDTGKTEHTWVFIDPATNDIILNTFVIMLLVVRWHVLLARPAYLRKDLQGHKSHQYQSEYKYIYKHQVRMYFSNFKLYTNNSSFVNYS